MQCLSGAAEYFTQMDDEINGMLSGPIKSKARRSDVNNNVQAAQTIGRF